MTLSANPCYPDFFRIRQHFESHAVHDVALEVDRALDAAQLSKRVQPGHRVAIAVGSRGIANLRQIVAEVVRGVRALGGTPMIVPAMGSHGGATAEGQAAMLASFGIDAESIGCQIESSMETIVVGTTEDGVDVHFDKQASEADHVIVINRIKPHTRLVGGLESGLTKMMMIGLGKHQGALLYHQVFPDYDYCLDKLAPSIVPMIVERMPITLGLAIVEDAFEQTSLIEPVLPDEILTKEPELLSLAKTRMPRLPFDDADLLIIDRMGKEISGTGMDTNVVGRKSNDNCAGVDEYPKIRQIYVRSLTAKSAGNASGIGIAEYCHERLVQAMDAEVTRINCVTSAHVSAGAVPLSFPSDRAVLDAVVSQVGKDRIPDLKWMWISDTLNVSELACSRAYLESARQREDLEILSDVCPLDFDSEENLISTGE